MKKINWGVLTFYLTIAVLSIVYCIRISKLG